MVSFVGKVRTQGGAIVVEVPKEKLEDLGVGAGDKVLVSLLREGR